MNTLLNRWIIMLAVIVAGLVGFFWRDLAEQTSDSVTDFFSADVEPEGLTDDALAHGKGYHLGRLRNNVDQLHVSGLRVESMSGSRRTISFMLQSKAPDNDYPTLQVELYSAAGVLLRKVSFAPGQYSHGDTLSAEEIHLDVEPAAAEVRADVRPVYPQDAR